MMMMCKTFFSVALSSLRSEMCKKWMSRVSCAGNHAQEPSVTKQRKEKEEDDDDELKVFFLSFYLFN